VRHPAHPANPSKFNTLIQFALVGAVAFFGYRAYKRSQGAR
jgi:hypothetical protein